MHLLDQWLYLVYALIDRSQSHIPFDGLTPSLTDHAQTLPHATAKEHILIQVEPKSLVFFEKTKRTDPIMMAVLTLKHWDSRVLYMPPSCLQISFIVPITRKLIGIPASTVPTHPINLPFLAADVAIGSFLSS